MQAPASRPGPRRVVWASALLLALALSILLGWWLGHRSQAAAPAPDAQPAPTALQVQAITEFSPEQLQQEQLSGDWLLHRLSGDPAVLVIEFPDLQSQGLALNRVAALVEKSKGNREQVLNDAALQALIRSEGDTTASFYLGHDYTAANLARFFQLAQAQGITLNSSELRLRQVLLDAGTLLPGPGEPGQFRGAEPGALVTFSAAQAINANTPPAERMDATRRGSVMAHELSHGRYFTDKAYRDHCWFFWRSLLTDNERTLWRRYLGDLGYDNQSEDLMVNETQALLMHTPDTRDFNAAALHLNDAELEALRDRFKLGLTDSLR